MDGMRVTALEPMVVLPETTLLVRGTGFVGDRLGTSRLRVSGTTQLVDGGSTGLDTTLPLSQGSLTELFVDLGAGGYGTFCSAGPGDFVGAARVEVASVATGEAHATPEVAVGLRCRERLSPALLALEDGEYTLNAAMHVTADDLLLGGAEGGSELTLSGCFLPQGAPAPCSVNGASFSDLRAPVEVTDRYLRRDGVVLVSPALAGLRVGTVEGEAQVLSTHGDGFVTASDPLPWTFSLLPMRLEAVETAGASLGGYVDFLGAGFVGAASDEVTEIEVVGSFQPDGGGPARPVNAILITAFDSGERARYVLTEDAGDPLHGVVDLRTESGTLSGTFTPRIAKGMEEQPGDPVAGSFRVEPVKQVVYVNFTPGFVDALERFGLRAADARVRERILAKARYTYRGLNVEFRTEVPDDYLLYAQVDLTGFDPNGLGLMGYDNSPGKDVGNLRLYDRIGGVNALTQQDGYPGFGGVFVESFLAFSRHPPAGMEPIGGASERFDAVFDPLRPDLGLPATADEVDSLSPPTSGAGCPSTSGARLEVIGCGVWVLGNLLGGTLAHEFAHSLGLADPEGTRFHNPGDQPNRLMDEGGARSYAERAEVDGGGPEEFCREDYDYLRGLLPTAEADPLDYRVSCF
jgi:hypothetical protein